MTTELTDDERFSNDEVSSLIQDCIDSVIGDKYYSNEEKEAWCTNISSTCIANLNKLSKPYKYTLNCIIEQKNGAGIHSACSCYWDNTNDAVCSVNWENATTRCIVIVFAFAL